MHDEHNTERSEDTAPPDETAPPLDDGRPADGAGTDDGRQAGGTGAADGHPADGAGTADGQQAGGTGAADGHPADGAGAADGRQAGGTGADDGHPADGTGAADGHPADGAGADDGHPAGGTGAADGHPADGAGADRSEADDIDRLQRERDEYYERLLRTTADFDNYRKRTDRERRELAEHAAMALLTDLLPLVDDLERALAADAPDGDVDRRGVEIIHKQLIDLLAARGVAPIEALGADFDPNLHQAVAHEPSEAHRDGEVIEELRRGYTLRDRLLRASMVKVAKA